MKTKTILKGLIVSALAVCITASVAACSKTQATTTANGTTATANEAPASQGKEVTNITFWYSWTDAIQENNIALTEEFNKTVGKDLGINVSAEYQGTYEDLHQKLQAAYVAGETPAVTVMEIASVKTFSNNGVLEPLDKFIERDNVDMDDFQPGLMTNSFYNGSTYGLPYLRSTPILYLNTTILKEAGLDPAGPKTWDELEKYIMTIKDKTGINGLTTYSYIWTLEAFMMEHGSSVLNEDETATNLNSLAGKEIISYFKNLSDQGYINLIASSQSDKLKADIMNQNCAMWFSSTGDLTSNIKIAEDNGFELGTAFIPKDTQYGVTSGGCNLIMTSKLTDEEKEAAWQFIKWMTEKEQTIKASQNTGYLPSRISAKDSEEMLTLYKEVPQFKVALDQLQYAIGRPSNQGYAESSTRITEALDAIYVNDQNMDEVLTQLESTVNKLLNE
ncbi:MAG: ABC transporter substrate-binding protein [Sedimentibacter sp.]